MEHIYKKIYTCFEKNQHIPFELMYEYILKYIKNNQIEDAYTKVIHEDGKGMGYSDESRILRVDLTSLSIPHKQALKLFSSHYHTYIDNLYYLYYINHELNHTKQNSQKYYEKHKSSLYYGEYARSDWLFCLMENTLKQKQYQKYHDYFLFEYMSTFNGKREIETMYHQFMKQVIPEEVMHFYECATARQILISYRNPITKEMASPIQIVNMLYEEFIQTIDINQQSKEFLDLYLNKKYFREIQQVIQQYQNADTFTKLKLGLPISDKMIQYLSEVSSGYQKTNHLFKDIKKL